MAKSTNPRLNCPGLEEATWLDAFTEKMGRASEAEKEFYERRRALGLGVGMDAAGKLVYARDSAGS